MGYSDASLVAMCQSGNMGAFEELVRRYQRRIYNLVCRTMGSTEGSEDIAQEVFLKAYKSIGKFKGRSNFYTWLFRIAINTCIDEMRKRQRKAQTLELSEAADCGEDPRGEDIRGRLSAALASLSPGHRMILTLREVEGFSYGEIAEIIGCRVGTVKSRLSRAREELKNRFFSIS
ncbi:MAG: RNA polymerase sigma factor [bacterium]